MGAVPKVDVVGVGLNAADTLIPVPEFPKRGSKVEITSADPLLGGQVASAMVACQQWGLRTRYVGKLGEDHAATLHRKEFERLGVETHLLTTPKCHSQQAFILVDPSGERTVLWKRDARLTLLPEELKREWIVNARVLHVDGHDTAAAVASGEMGERGRSFGSGGSGQSLFWVRNIIAEHRFSDYQPGYPPAFDERSRSTDCIAGHAEEIRMSAGCRDIG